MPLHVLSAGKDKLTVLFETPTDVSELFCELRRVPKKKSFMGSHLSKKERRARFNEMNQRTKTLLRRQVSGKKWKIQVPLVYENIGDKDILRCAAIGPEGDYVGWSKVEQGGSEISGDLN